MKTQELIILISAIIILGALAIAESYTAHHYKILLIDFGHARYIVNPQTGASHLEIDKPNN